MKKLSSFLAVVLMVFLMSGSAFAEQIKLDAKTRSNLTKLITVVANNFPGGRFVVTDPSNERLIILAINIINKDLVDTNRGKVNEQYQLPKEEVSDLIMKYFGRKIRHMSVPGFSYDGNAYHFSLYTPYDGFIIKNVHLKTEPTGLFTADADVYYEELGGSLFRSNHVTLRVRRIDEKGLARYVMVQYKSSK